MIYTPVPVMASASADATASGNASPSSPPPPPPPLGAAAPDAASTLSLRGRRALTPALSYGPATMLACQRPWCVRPPANTAERLSASGARRSAPRHPRSPPALSTRIDPAAPLGSLFERRTPRTPFGHGDPTRSPLDPGGYVKLSVAENVLTSDMVRERLQSPSALAAVLPPSLHYSDFRGGRPLRAALARLLEATSMQGLELDPQHITVLAGAGAVLESLFWVLAGPKEGVLVPAPYYPAFDNDLR